MHFNTLNAVRIKRTESNPVKVNKKSCFHLVFCVFLSCLSAPIFASDLSEKEKSISNPNILKYDTLVCVRLNVNSEFDFFKISGNDFYYDIRPNINLWNKLSVSYQHLTMNIGFKPAFLPGNGNNELKGETKSFSFGVQGYTKHWILELNYFKTKGFYLKNSGDFRTGWTEGVDPYIQFPELGIKAFRGATGYKFNPDFSLRAISMQTEKQLKSSGSFIAFLNNDLFDIDNRGKNIDTTRQTGQISKNFLLNGSLGYMYTHVIGSDFYASLGILTGGGFQHIKLKTITPAGDIETQYTDPVFRMIEKAAFGYNHNRLYTGAEISLTQAIQMHKSTSVNTKTNRTYFQVFLGYRFNAPGFLKKRMKKVMNFAPEIIKKNLE